MTFDQYFSRNYPLSWTLMKQGEKDGMKNKLITLGFATIYSQNLTFPPELSFFHPPTGSPRLERIGALKRKN